MLTETVRKLYHKDVVLNHAQRGSPGYEPICNHRHPTVAIPREGGGVWVRPAHPLTTEAFNAYIQVMRHHGETMPGAGGLGNCRNIGTSDRPSLHAYLCAIDIPPNSRKSRAFLRDIKAIRTNSGATVFRNLLGDRMHDQINCSPTALATGIDWTTVVGDGGGDEDDMETIKAIQKQCNAGGFKGADGKVLDVDGLLGPNTQHAMNALAEAASVPGEKGDDGDKGDRGLQGAKGADGNDGPKGAQGIQGDPGQRGLAGDDGADGKPATLLISGDQSIP